MVSPQSIRPEKERGGRIGRKQRRRRELGFRRRRREEDEGPDRRDPPVSGSGRARAAADWAGWAEKREKAVLGRLSAQSQKKTFFKTFSI
uniref:Uncharacterized protein n=1 Tax=Oryza sativa subsp. japonica TaxID=39947 RepID=Q5VNE9_ORYSJ|nr:hypothetical protein [Oryza sativa Japonica Group]